MRILLLIVCLLIASPAWGEDFVRLYQDPGTFNPHLSLNGDKERYLSLDKLRAIDCAEIERLKAENAELRERLRCPLGMDISGECLRASHELKAENAKLKRQISLRNDLIEKMQDPKCHWEVRVYPSFYSSHTLNSWLKKNPQWEPFGTHSPGMSPDFWLKRRVCE